MPGFDGTGPKGLGPKTGRGAGPCPGTYGQNMQNTQGQQNRGRSGFGIGQGLRGMRRRRRFGR